MIAESKLSTDDNVAKLFSECKDFVVASFHGDAWIDKIDDICQVHLPTTEYHAVLVLVFHTNLLVLYLPICGCSVGIFDEVLYN